jgi:hypothetical protein
MLLQAFGNAPRCLDILAAGKAMGKQRDRPDRAAWPVEQRRQRLALRVGKIEFFGGHQGLLRGIEGALWRLRSAAGSGN